jgi:hypothetical protein
MKTPRDARPARTAHLTPTRIALAIALSTLAAAPLALAADLGRSHVLAGQSGEKVRVTLRATRDNVGGYDVGAGKRLYCVTVSVANVGHKRFSDAPANDGVIVVRGGGEEHASIATGGSCDTLGLLKLAPGQHRTITLPFALRKGARPQSFEFTTSSGYGQKGAWKLP